MAIDIRKVVQAAVEAATQQTPSQSEPKPRKPHLSAGKGLLLGAGVVTAGRLIAGSRGQQLLGSLQQRIEEYVEEPEELEDEEDFEDEEEEAEDDEDFEDEEEFEEPEAEDEEDFEDEEDEPEDDEDFEDEEPEAEDQEDFEDEEDDEEPEAEDEEDFEDEEDDEERPHVRRPPRSRERSRA